MPFPFVSRERLTERDAIIAELKAKISELEADRKHWINQFGWRLSGIAPYPELLPKDSRLGAPVTEPSKTGMDQEIPTRIEKAQKDAGTANPRAVLSQLQKQADETWARANGTLPMPAPGAPKKHIEVVHDFIENALEPKGA